MNSRKKRLILEQMDRKLKPFIELAHMPMPEEGWVYSIRKALNISLRQLGKKLGVSPQAIKALEQREKNGTITMKSLKDIAKSINMHLLYALVPDDGSLEELVNKRAIGIAKEIVNRTSQSMK